MREVFKERELVAQLVFLITLILGLWLYSLHLDEGCRKRGMVLANTVRGYQCVRDN
jgi:hypothetical protein